MSDAISNHPGKVLSSLARSAERLAQTRSQACNGAHFLLVLIQRGGTVGKLLQEAGVSEEAVRRVAERWASGHEQPSTLLRSAATEADVPSELSGEAMALLSLISVRAGAAHRALKLAGVDVSELREKVLEQHRPAAPRRVALASNRSAATSRAVTVPLTPNVGRSVPASPKPLASRRLPQGQIGSARPRATSTARRTGSCFALEPRRFKWLRKLGKNLTLLAENGELPRVVGREAEVEQLLDVLAKREGNNPCLVGASGVGKTSVVHALAQHVAEATEATDADRRIVVEVQAADLLSGTAMRGALSQRLLQLKSEVAAGNGRVVLFIDDLHALFEADAADEVALELSRALSGELVCVVATTEEHYDRAMARGAGLERHLSRVDVLEPDAEEACEILEFVARRFAEHHEVAYEPEALASAIAWSSRYLPGRALPEKALSIIDLAGARCHRRGLPSVGSEHVADVVAELSHVPRERLLQSDSERLLALEEALAERVVGHEEQLAAICRIVRRNAAGFQGQRPIGTFLLLGPTGVGKTETAKALAHALFGSEQAMTRLDLSEYSEAHAVARLIGAPPGYVGHEAGGQLTEAVRRRPYQVLLLDEIEKAHPEVLATFLPLFDEGRLTDGRGRTVDFNNVLIMLTSNLGAREAAGGRARRVGFGHSGRPEGGVPERVVSAARERLTPEFFNRIDEALVFSPLSEKDVENIARRMLQTLADRVYQQRDVELLIETSVVELLLRKGGFEASLGARPMRRAIARWVEAPLAEAFLRGEFEDGARVRMRAEGHGLALTAEAAAAE